MKALAAVIQEGRADLHLSVDELAERSGVSPNDIWSILSPDRSFIPSPDQATITGLARALHQPARVLTVAVMIDEEEEAVAPR